MGSRFVAALLISFTVCLLLLGGAGFAVTQLLVPAPRDPFRGDYFEFILAKGWQCEPDGTEVICAPPGKEPHAALAVMATKERNAQDTLDVYEAHLRQPQDINRDSKAKAGSAPQMSVIRKVGRRTLGRTTWVEAVHESSEIANFNTYYLGTVTASIGILVTMTVQKEAEAQYQQELQEMMSTLRVYQR